MDAKTPAARTETMDQCPTAGRTEMSPTTAALIRGYADGILDIKGRIKLLQDDISARYAAAKSQGLDRAALAELVRRLGADRDGLREHELLTTLYETAYQSAGLDDLLGADRG